MERFQAIWVMHFRFAVMHFWVLASRMTGYTLSLDWFEAKWLIPSGDRQ